MPQISAGLLLYRRRPHGLEVLLVHPGGPYWGKKDEGAWSIPKGEIIAGEEPLTAATREFGEELGFEPRGQFIPLTTIRQKAGKTVHAWAFEGDCDPASVRSNTFAIEWPPRSGRQVEFPEIDRVEFFGIQDAKRKINPAQAQWLDELARHAAGS